MGYIAPEQIQGRPIDGRVDVYSLGCVLFECLTGAAPFERQTDVAILMAHVEAVPPSVAAARPELPASIDGVIAQALAKDPDDLFPSAGALAAALGDALGPRASATTLTRGFLFADLRGYTEFTETNGDRAAVELLDA